ncbi:required for hyphal anastomosis (HAM-2) protein, putative [Babesia caballi]|uniref:Required for hyphal anastomosis (HAM-2) protein, putative n=1 Tax=Babesia caballi TaxID=5871 RepID=A0AAV4LZD9_BABCB|nr:required for hyphal anastomosis (HAM-2) protein, putative [Babesia caballi]
MVFGARTPINFFLKFGGKAGVGEWGRRRLPHPLSELTELIERTLGNVRAPLIRVNIRGQEPLAVEVRSQGATAKRQIAPPAAVLMTPPIDVGEGLVVKRQAAEEYLGALSLLGNTDTIPLGVRIIAFIVVRRICFSLKLGDECRGGVADRGEYSGVGE